MWFRIKSGVARLSGIIIKLKNTMWTENPCFTRPCGLKNHVYWTMWTEKISGSGDYVDTEYIEVQETMWTENLTASRKVLRKVYSQMARQSNLQIGHSSCQ